MNRATKGFGMLLLGLVLILPACKPEADTDENRLKAAQEHQEVSLLKTTLGKALQDMSKQFPLEQQEDFVKYMQENIGFDVVEQKAVRAMADHFTVQEIRALTKFYRSPEGNSINQKYDEYLGDIMPVVQTQIGQAGSAWMAKQQQSQLGPLAQPPASMQQPDQAQTMQVPETEGQ